MNSGVWKYFYVRDQEKRGEFETVRENYRSKGLINT